MLTRMQAVRSAFRQFVVIRLRVDSGLYPRTRDRRTVSVFSIVYGAHEPWPYNGADELHSVFDKRKIQDNWRMTGPQIRQWRQAHS